MVAESRAAADRAYEEGDPTGAWSALRLLKTVRHPDADSLEARFTARFREEPLARIAELKAALPSADASTRWALLDTILTESRLAWHSSADSTQLDLRPTFDSFVRGSPADSPVRSLLTVEKVGAEVLAGLTDRQFERIRDQLAALAEDAQRVVEAPRSRPSTGLAGELAAHDERMTAYQRSFAEGGEERWKEVTESRVALDERLVTEAERAAAEGRHATAAALLLARGRLWGKKPSTAPLHAPAEDGDHASKARVHLALMADQLLPSLAEAPPELLAALGDARIGQSWGAVQHAGVQPLALVELKGPAASLTLGQTALTNAKRTEVTLLSTYTRYKQRESTASVKARVEAGGRADRIAELTSSIAYMKANRGSGGYDTVREAQFGYGASSRQLASAGSKGQHGSDYVDRPSFDSTTYQPAVKKRTYSEEQVRAAEAELHALSRGSTTPGVEYELIEVPITVRDTHETWTGKATRDLTLTVNGKTFSQRQSLDLGQLLFVQSPGDPEWDVPQRDERQKTPENLSRWVSGQFDLALPETVSTLVAEAIAAQVETRDPRWAPADAAVEVALRKSFFGVPSAADAERVAPIVAAWSWPELSAKRSTDRARENLSTGDLTLSTQVDTRMLTFSPSGRSIAAGGNGAVFTFSARDGAGETLVGIGDHPKLVRYAEDESTILAATKDRLDVLDASRGHLIRSLALEDHVVPSVSRAGDRVLVYSDERIWMWSPATGEQIGPDLYTTKTANAVGLSADGALACIADGTSVKVVDTATAEVLFHGEYDERRPVDCRISPDGSMVVGHFRLGDDNRVVIFDVEAKTPLDDLDMKVHEDLPGFAFRPDGLVYAWNPSAEEVIQDLTPTGRRVGLPEPRSFKTRGKGRSLSFSLDGRLLLQGTTDGSSVYRADDGSHLTDWKGSRAALSPDGTRIVGSIYVGKPTGELSLHRIARDQATQVRRQGALATITEVSEDKVVLNRGTKAGVAVEQIVVGDGMPIGVVSSVTADSAEVRVYLGERTAKVGGTVVTVMSN